MACWLFSCFEQGETYLPQRQSARLTLLADAPARFGANRGRQRKLLLKRWSRSERGERNQLHSRRMVPKLFFLPNICIRFIYVCLYSFAFPKSRNVIVFESSSLSIKCVLRCSDDLRAALLGPYSRAFLGTSPKQRLSIGSFMSDDR